MDLESLGASCGVLGALFFMLACGLVSKSALGASGLGFGSILNRVGMDFGSVLGGLGEGI